MKTLLYIHKREDDAKKSIAPYFHCSGIQTKIAVRIRKKAVLNFKENQKRKKYQKKKKYVKEEQMKNKTAFSGQNRRW